MSLLDFSAYGAAAEKLSRAVQHGMVSQAYIIEGDHNVPKEEFSRNFAKAILCREKPGVGCDHCRTCRNIDGGNYEDLYLVRPSDTTGKNTGILSVKNEQIDDLIRDLMGVPTGGPRNIAIVTDADTMTASAQNHFLKTLEEPSAGTVIMLLSENRDNLLATIQSRCVTVRLTDIGRSEGSGMEPFAEQILGDIRRGAYFFDLKKALEEKLEKRADAYAFFDGMESALGKCLRGGGAFSPAQAASAVSFVEEARRAVQQNGSYKYAAKNLILRCTALQSEQI